MRSPRRYPSTTHPSEPLRRSRRDLSDEIGLYVSWARGFKSGGFNEFAVNAQNPLEFESERMAAREADAKMQLLDGVASLNVGLFPAPCRVADALGNTPVHGPGASRVSPRELPSGVRGHRRRCSVRPIGPAALPDPKWTATLVPSASFPLAGIPGVSACPLVSGVDLTSHLAAEYQDVHLVHESSDPRTRQPAFFASVSAGFRNQGQGWSVGRRQPDRRGGPPIAIRLPFAYVLLT